MSGAVTCAHRAVIKTLKKKSRVLAFDGIMTSKPKIAVCLSGQPRTWRHCIDSHKHLFQNFDTDYYLHGWDDVSVEERADLIHAYAAVEAVFEPRPDLAERQLALARRFPVMPSVHVFDMIYAVDKALNLAFDSGKEYDFYARLRYDILFNGKFDKIKLSDSEIYLFDWGNPICADDMFAIGTLDVMKRYAKFFDWLDPNKLDNHINNGMLKPEFALNTYLEELHVSKKHIQKIKRKLVRPRMAGRSFDNIRDDIFGQVEKHDLINQRIRTLAPNDQFPRESFHHTYRDTLPIHAMQERILQVTATWPQRSQADLLSGPWTDRLALSGQILAVGFPNLSFVQPLSQNTVTHARLLATVLLSQMDLTIPLDRFGVVLCSLSYERPDSELCSAWVNGHPKEAAQLLLDNEVASMAPNLFQILLHLSSVARMTA